jgi:hypothetical protein
LQHFITDPFAIVHELFDRIFQIRKNLFIGYLNIVGQNLNIAVKVLSLAKKD